MFGTDSYTAVLAPLVEPGAVIQWGWRPLQVLTVSSSTQQGSQVLTFGMQPIDGSARTIHADIAPTWVLMVRNEPTNEAHNA